jgi:hypothetical protein
LFLRLQDEVLQTQKALERAALAAISPLASTPQAESLLELQKRRDALLLEWGRAGLAVLVGGGQLQVLGQAAAVRSRGASPAPAPAPVPAPAPAPAPKGPPADAAALRALADRGVGPTWTRAVQSEPRDTDEPVSLDDELAAVAMSPGQPDDREELARLVVAVGQIQGGVWTGAPRDAQRAFVGNIVARARHLQDERDTAHWTSEDEDNLDRVFSAFTGFSKRARPGFVFGLMRSHTPQKGSWIDDARDWWEQLVRQLQPAAPEVNPERALAALEELTPPPEGTTDDALCAAFDAILDAQVDAEDPRLVRLASDHMDVLRSHARYKRIRKAVRQAQKDDEASDAELQQGRAIPADWSLWERVRGKSAVIIGGDLRADARDRIQEAFELSSLEWHTTDHGRNIQRVANAVAGGSVELVIILRRFIGHDVDRIVIPACKDAGVPWVSVERGYGITQIQAAMERFIGES